MPSIRVGFSSDLNITGGNTGIGTETPTARLEVSNGIVAERAAGSGGISTFKEYQGFSQTLATLPHEIATEEGVFSSLSGEIKITGETTVSSGSTVEVGKTKTLTVTDRFAVPLGETNNRDNAPEAGTTRFNQDFGTLEFFDGVNWKTVNSYNRGGAAGRAVIAQGNGGPSPANIATMEYVNLNTRGNGQNFGDALVASNAMIGGCSDGTRGVWCGTFSSPASTIQYTTITSGGGSINFGSMNEMIYRGAGHSSSTRGLWMSGRKSPGNAIVSCQTIQIQTLGDSVDFGDAAAGRRGHDSGMGSPTRAFMLGGYDNSDYTQDTQFKSIASGGDMVFGGDLVYKGGYIAGCSNSIRGFGTGGYQHPGGAGYFATNINSIDLASAGNAVNFGDLTQKGAYAVSAATQTRAFRFGGIQFNPAEVYISRIEDWSTTSSGNATEFGDLTQGKYDQAQMSDSHGGLGGF
jgi:hypothetical protein